MVEHHIGRTDCQVANPRSGAHVAKVNQAGDLARTIAQRDEDIVIVQIVMHRLWRHRLHGRKRRCKLSANLLQQSAPLRVSDRPKLRGDPAGPHKIPFEITLQARMLKSLKCLRQTRRNAAQFLNQDRIMGAELGIAHAGQRLLQPDQPRLSGSVAHFCYQIARLRRDHTGHRQVGGRFGHMRQRGGLHVDQRAVTSRPHDLEHIARPIAGRGTEVEVIFAIEPLQLGVYPPALGQHF